MASGSRRAWRQFVALRPLQILANARDGHDMRILSFYLLPNHWHLVVWLRNDGRLLCASWDDFMVVKLADDVRKAIKKPPC
jgi:hypothetical protein